MDPEDAVPWLHGDPVHSADEVARLPSLESAKCQPVAVPEIGQDGSPVLVRGCMHLVGVKCIKVGSEDQQIHVQETHVLAVTCYKDE